MKQSNLNEIHQLEPSKGVNWKPDVSWKVFFGQIQTKNVKCWLIFFALGVAYYYHEHYHLKQSDFLLFVKGTNRSLQYETFIEPIAYRQNIYITTNINS